MRRILIAFLLTVTFLAYSAWIKAPSTFSIAVQAAQAGNPDTVVWVDTSSSIYHCPGSQFYGKTQPGRYMKQIEAQQKGYRPAYGWVCK